MFKLQHEDKDIYLFGEWDPVMAEEKHDEQKGVEPIIKALIMWASGTPITQIAQELGYSAAIVEDMLRKELVYREMYRRRVRASLQGLINNIMGLAHIRRPKVVLPIKPGEEFERGLDRGYLEALQEAAQQVQDVVDEALLGVQK